MKTNQIKIGKIFGIPIDIDYSWFLIFILLTWILASDYFPTQFKGWTVALYWSAAFITSIFFFASVLLHELGHSFIAKKYKIKVRKITLFVFGGLAEIEEEPKKAKEEFWIAIAGPLTSFLLAGVFYLFQEIFSMFSFWTDIFKYLAFINFILAIFNLVPGFPLDGGRILRAIVWGFTKNFHKATITASIAGRFFGFLFIFIGVLQIFGGAVGDGIWTAFIGWFLESAAFSQMQKQALDKLLAGHKVQDAYSRNYALVPADTSLEEFIDNKILVGHRRFFFVEKDDEIIGILTIHNLHKIPKVKWNTTFVTEVMMSISEIKKLYADQPILDALKEMDKDGVNQLPVYDNNNLIGILSRESVITYLRQLHDANK